MLPAKTSTATGQPSRCRVKRSPSVRDPAWHPIVAEGDDVALGVGSFKVAAADVVEHEMTILEMTSRQSALNRAVASRSRSIGR